MRRETTATSFTVETVAGLGEVEKSAWDRLANPGWEVGPDGGFREAGAARPPRPFNPFLSYAFLSALEDSGCVGGRTGWYPRHLLVREGCGGIVAAAPAYLKTHSQGEYVFDYGWADAFERAGGRYYPKLQVSVPFTPATGPRLLVADEGAGSPLRDLLARGLAAMADQLDLSSVHVTFVSDADRAALAAAGYLERTGTQFHFVSDGYANFDAFLAALASRKRKQIRRERRDALADDIEIEWVSGSDLTEDHWDTFYKFYMDTGSRKWGRPYLNRQFFSLLGERLAGSTVLILAKRGRRTVAGALNLMGSETLFGRYWGCVEDHPFLHFEVCYYQAIDFALAHGLTRVEAGAQGEHKLLRGYRPTPVHSGHWVTHEGLRDAIGAYLERERRSVAADGEALGEFTPFRKGERQQD